MIQLNNSRNTWDKISTLSRLWNTKIVQRGFGNCFWGDSEILGLTLGVGFELGLIKPLVIILCTHHKSFLGPLAANFFKKLSVCAVLKRSSAFDEKV